MKKFPEMQDWVYEKDFFADDLIIITNYMFQKNRQPIDELGYELMISKERGHLRTYLQETELSKLKHFSQEINKNHRLFNTAIDFDKLTAMKIEQFKPGHILNSHWRNIKNKIETSGLFLHGLFDTGKTFILKLITKELFYQKKDFLFLFMPELPKQFQTHLYDENFNQKINLLKKVSYLILDDFGTENLNKFLRDDVLFVVLNYRQENKLTTLFSSNYNIDNLIEHLTLPQDKNSILAFKIIHKLKKLCHFYEFKEKEEKNYLK